MIRFLPDRGYLIPSPALLGKIGRDYVNQITAFNAQNQIPAVKLSRAM